MRYDLKVSSLDENAVCDVCYQKSVFFCNRLGFRYFECLSCGLLFINPKPPATEIEQLYVEQEEVNPKETRKLDKLIANIEIVIERPEARPLKVLDIGSQNGTFLQRLKSIKRIELHGIEPSLEAFKKSKIDPELNVKLGFFDSSEYSPGYFDLVHLGDVIEHLQNPVKMVEEVKSILGSRGYFIVTTPVTDCPYVEIFNSQHKKLRAKLPLAYLTPPHHLLYFRSTGLDELMKSANFSKKLSWTTAPSYWYELSQSRILLGFRSKRIWEKLNPELVIKLLLFSFVYGYARMVTIVKRKDFSYSAIYQLNSKSEID